MSVGNCNVFLIQGTPDQGQAEALIRESVDSIKNKLKDSVDFASEFFTFDSSMLDEIIACIVNFPLFSENKLVVVEQAQNLNSEQCKRLTSCLDLLQQTFLILISRGKTGRILLEKVMSCGKVIDHSKARSRDIGKLIENQFNLAGRNITKEAVDYILARLGGDTSLIKSEIEKIVAFSSSGEIGVRNIEPVISSAESVNIFEMLDAVVEGKARLAFEKLGSVCAKDDPMFVLNMLKRHYRLIAKSKSLSPEQVVSKLKQHQFVAQKLSRQARRFDIRMMRQVFEILLSTEKDAKSGKDPLFAVQKAVMELSVL